MSNHGSYWEPRIRSKGLAVFENWRFACPVLDVSRRQQERAFEGEQVQEQEQEQEQV